VSEPQPSSGAARRTAALTEPSAAAPGAGEVTVPLPEASPGPPAPTPAAGAARYELGEEIARGGMGAVLRARDTSLGRDLAVKVLLPRRADDAAARRRFVEEARIAAALQHPGAVPVYDLAALPDGRPFFAMKLVEGRTLADYLKDRASPADNLPRLLQVFEQVCQTVAYAHSRNVIHRDLKPQNVMVGAFGEVQVMDWGLAKDLGAPPEGPAPPAEAEGDDTLTREGSVIGTPAYLSPEQARGDVAALDRRCDVFGLGAILCELLTGKPPFTGATGREMLRRARAGDLGEAFARLDGCGADADLVALARACLSADPAGRPPDGTAVADAVEAHLEAVAGRLRAAETERAAALARAAAERTARRRTLALAAAVLLALAAGGAAWLAERSARAARRARAADAVAVALEDAAAAHARARAAADEDDAPWADARAALARADEVLGQGEAGPDLRRRVAALRDEVEAGERAARARADDRRRDRVMLDRLERVRPEAAEPGDEAAAARPGAAEAYAAAFRAYGVDVEALPPEEAGARLHARPIAVELAAALDLWAWVEYEEWAAERRQALEGLGPARRAAAEAQRALRLAGLSAAWRRRAQAAQAADPDPVRRRLREALGRLDFDAVSGLTAEVDVSAQPPATLLLIGQALATGRRFPEAAAWLRRAARERPDDFWLQQRLALVLEQLRPAPWDEVARADAAALALRPDSVDVPLHLAQALQRKGDAEEALAVLRRAARRHPEQHLVRHRLGNLLRDLGRPAEAADAYLASLRRRPDYMPSRYNLGLVRGAQGRNAAAAACFRAVTESNPDNFGAWLNLGQYALKLGRFEEAARAYAEAVRLRPDFAPAHCALGEALVRSGRFAEGLAERRLGHELGSAQPGWDRPSARWVREAERLVELEALLPCVLGGAAKVRPAERVELARMCVLKKQHALAARLYGEAFAASPNLAESRKGAPNRFRAAVAAARAAAGQGDGAGLAEQERARLRGQALAWLRADVRAWQAETARGGATAEEARVGLERLRMAGDLARLREPARLEALPEVERAAWLALWADVEALLRRCRQG
jgi:serine/threonine-protein kinase